MTISTSVACAHQLPTGTVSRLPSCTRQANPAPTPRRQRKPELFLPGAWISALQTLESLRKSYRNITRLRQGVLLSQADPRSAVERQILPAGAQLLPALGPVFERIGAVEARLAVHDVGAIHEECSRWDENGRFAVFAAADGKHGIVNRFPGVGGNDRVDAER